MMPYVIFATFIDTRDNLAWTSSSLIMLMDTFSHFSFVMPIKNVLLHTIYNTYTENWKMLSVVYVLNIIR